MNEKQDYKESEDERETDHNDTNNTTTEGWMCSLLGCDDLINE